MRDTAVRQSCQFPLREISALCARSTASGRELLAIGDEAFEIAVAELGASGVGEAVITDLLPRLPGGERSEGDGSQWEGLAADREGKVFVLEEGGKVFVFSPDLDELVQTIHLDVSESTDPSVRDLFADPNAGAEALVLLPPGGLLVAKQKEPIMLVYFGPPGSGAGALEPPSLAREIQFELSDEPRTVLTALRHWTMREEDEDDIESINDLAVDVAGTLHAISSKARRLCRLRVGDREVEIAESWRLAHAVEASKKRKAEGLAFGAQSDPFVAVDTKDDDDNVFVLANLDD
jgi:hypothetical protein